MNMVPFLWAPFFGPFPRAPERSQECPGAWHGLYEAIPSNFGRVWSYMAWGKSIFMFFGNAGNSLHHQIPPNWSTDSFESQGTISGAIKPINFPKNDTRKTYFLGNQKTAQTLYFLIKWLSFVFLFLGPMPSLGPQYKILV